MEDKDYLRIVNTILAVYRIDIVLTSIEELVPSLWVVLLELHFQKLQANQVHINHVEIPPGSSDVEMVKWVVKGLELIAGFDLEHLDCAGITRIEMKYVKPLVELFWELFKALDASVSIESVANIDVEADIETITKTDEKSIQVDIDDKLDETTRSNMTSQSQTKRKKLNPLNLSAEEMREYGLEPIKSDGEGRPKSKKRLRFRSNSPQRDTTIPKSVDKVEVMLKSHKDAYNWKPKDLEWLKRFGSRSELDHESGNDKDWSEIEAHLSTILDPYTFPETRAEENLEKLFKEFTDVVPLIRSFPVSEREKAWKSQLGLSKRALEDRLWNQKVMMQKSKPLDNSPVEIFLKDTKKALKVERQRNETKSHLKIQSSLRDRYRKIKLLEHQYRKLKDETRRQLQKQEHLEDQLSAGIVKEYMDVQRKTILEERKVERDRQKEALEKAQKHEANMQGQLLQEIAMIKEEIANAGEEARIVRKAEEEELRSLRKETKGIQQNRIRSLKSNIAAEIESDNYRNETVKKIDIRFDLANKPQD